MVGNILASGLNAYQSAQKLAGKGIGNLTDTAPAEGAGSFAETLAGFAQDSLSTMKKGEATSIAAAKGQADITDVVTSVQAAMRTLETVTAVRDKVIGAYQEIMRMPI